MVGGYIGAGADGVEWELFQARGRGMLSRARWPVPRVSMRPHP